MSVVGRGLDVLAADAALSPAEKARAVRPDVSCHSSGDAKWRGGEFLHAVITNATRNSTDDAMDMEFDGDGSLQSVELKIVNLQSDDGNRNR